MERKSLRRKRVVEPGAEVFPTPKHYFNDKQFTAMWTRYFTLPQGDPERDAIRNDIVLASQLIAKARIRMLKLTAFAPEADLLQEAAFKVLRDFDKFDPTKARKKPASAFVYLTTIITNCLLTYVFKIRKQKNTFMQFPSSYSSSGGGADSVADKANDAADRITNSERVRLEARNWGEMVDRDNLSMMVLLLKDHKIGKEILIYITESSKVSETNGKGIFTLRSLMHHLKAKDFSIQECKQYLRQVKIEYKSASNVIMRSE